MIQFEEKTVEGTWPRGQASAKNYTDRFQNFYIKYKNPQPAPAGATTVNLIFAHGAGMTKKVWVPLIEDILERNKSQKNWVVGSILASDASISGDSGLLNKDKFGWACDWRDGGKDLIAMVKHEINTTGEFLPSARVRNVLIGHSMGGYFATYAAFLEPTLFDSCIAMEPVLFYDDSVHEFFVNRVAKLHKIIFDEFPTRQAAEDFFRKGSVFKTMDNRVLKEFIEDELYEENGRWRTKTAKRPQLSSYFTAMYSIYSGQRILQLLEIPYLYAQGTEAMWNHPAQGPWVQEHVPPGLLEFAELEGDHMVPFVNLKDTLDLVYGYIDRRVKFVEEHRDEFPEERFKNDPESTVPTMYDYLVKGDRHKGFFYGKPWPWTEPREEKL